jgi:hypothetical protein
MSRTISSQRSPRVIGNPPSVVPTIGAVPDPLKDGPGSAVCVVISFTGRDE